MLVIFQASCVEFIMQNEELLHTKTFQELSEGLQNELEELASWDQRAVGVGGDRPPPPGMWELSDMTARMRLRTDVSEVICCYKKPHFNEYGVGRPLVPKVL